MHDGMGLLEGTAGWAGMRWTKRGRRKFRTGLKKNRISTSTRKQTFESFKLKKLSFKLVT
jgi:hypothetical protein